MNKVTQSAILHAAAYDNIEESRKQLSDMLKNQSFEQLAIQLNGLLENWPDALVIPVQSTHYDDATSKYRIDLTLIVVYETVRA